MKKKKNAVSKHILFPYSLYKIKINESPCTRFWHLGYLPSCLLTLSIRRLNDSLPRHIIQLWGSWKLLLYFVALTIYTYEYYTAVPVHGGIRPKLNSPLFTKRGWILFTIQIFPLFVKNLVGPLICIGMYVLCILYLFVDTENYTTTEMVKYFALYIACRWVFVECKIECTTLMNIGRYVGYLPLYSDTYRGTLM